MDNRRLINPPHTLRRLVRRDIIPDNSPILEEAPADMADNNEPVAVIQNQLPLLAFNFKPPSFDGSQSENARKWINKFERYSDIAGAQVNERCGLMGLLMTGLAETWFNSLPEDVRQNYDQLRQAFEQKFIQVPATVMQRQLSTIQRTQQASESVDSYFTEARAKLNEHNFPQELSTTLLINGLRPEIKSLVLQHQPLDDIDDLLDKARHIEAALKAAPSNNNNGFPASAFAAVSREDLMVTMKDLDEAKKDMITEITRSMQSLQAVQHQRPTTPTRDAPERHVRFRDSPSCFRCGRTSHFARNCPFDRPEPAPRRPPTPFSRRPPLFGRNRAPPPRFQRRPYRPATRRFNPQGN